MSDFEELTLGSPAAKARGCSCAPTDSDQFKPDNDCPVHGDEAMRRMLEQFVTSRQGNDQSDLPETTSRA